MTTLRLLVGTHKGAFVLTSDERRKDWKIEGPHFAGWDVYHVKGSPAEPNRLFCLDIARLVRPGDPAVR